MKDENEKRVIRHYIVSGRNGELKTVTEYEPPTTNINKNIWIYTITKGMKTIK